MELEWIAEDHEETIAHATKLKIDNKTTVSPQHAHTRRDLQMASSSGKIEGFPKDRIIIAGESLSYQTFTEIGSNSGITEALTKRLEAKKTEGQINLVYSRIPKEYNLDGNIFQINNVDELKASALLGVQLEANASAIIPPLPNGIHSRKLFDSILERTKVELQTFRKNKDIVGLIPTTDDLGLVAEMVRKYIKTGVRFFAVDFSSSPLNRWLIRTTVRTIREELKIKDKAGENPDKYYYLHIFNVSSNRKTAQAIAPITDLLTHAYGVDSVSGVMWGGGKLVKEKLRFYNIDDYGSYRLDSLNKNGLKIPESLISGNEIKVYEKLRVRRLTDYAKECKRVLEKIPEIKGVNSYANYLNSKERVKGEMKKVRMDIKEIKAN